MDAEDLSHTVNPAICDDSRCAGGNALLVWLKQHSHGSVEVLASLIQQKSYSNRDGHVGIVAAEVSRPSHLRSIGDVLCVGSGEGVQLGPIGDRRSGMRTLDLYRESGGCDGPDDIESMVFQHPTQISGRLELVETNLGILVQVATNLDERIGEIDV